MIKFKAGRKGGRDLVGFGLTETNIDELKAGHPIYIMADEMALPFDVTIFYGKNEAEMAKKMMEAGLIGEDTIIHDSRGKKKIRQ